MQNFSKIPIEFCKTLHLKSDILNGEFQVPISTFELTLFKSIERGMLLSKYANPIYAYCDEHIMTRSVILKTNSLKNALNFKQQIEIQANNEVNNQINSKNLLQTEIEKYKILSSKYCRLISFYTEIVGCLIFLRFSFSTNEASGHNMTTKSSDEIVNFLLNRYSNYNLEYISISGNICTDKKNSAINGIMSRGRKVFAEIEISEKICRKILKTTPEKICNINYYKNFIGSNLAGSIRSANAHFANIIAGFYIATGQDVANVIEGSQGFTFCEVTKDNSLKFSINCPNIIIGSVGNGKNYDFVQRNIESIFALQNNLDNNGKDGFDKENLSKKLSIILGATILCGEISLLASLTNQGELIASHVKYER